MQTTDSISDQLNLTLKKIRSKLRGAEERYPRSDTYSQMKMIKADLILHI